MMLTRNGKAEGETGIFALTFSIASLFCIVVVVLGIKLRWFKHRLNFQGLSTTNNTSQSAVSRNGEPIAIQGVFRSRDDAENYFDVERPKSLPPVRIRKSLQKLQIPLPSKNEDLKLKSDQTKTEDVSSLVSSPLPTSAPPEIDEQTSSQFQIAEIQNPKFMSRTAISSNKHFKSNIKQENKKLNLVEPVLEKRKQNVKLKTENDFDMDSYSTVAERRPTGYVHKTVNEGNEPIPQSRRQFVKLKDNNDSDSDTHERSCIEQRRPTGYVRRELENGKQFVHLKDENEFNNNIYIAERRPTGYVPSQNHTDAQLSNSTFKLNGLSDSEEDTQNIFEKVKAKPKPIDNCPITEEENDSWSAVARRRHLNEEIAIYNTVNITTESNEFRNPLIDKPKTMRDMKRQNEVSRKNETITFSKSDDDTEA